MSPPGDAPFGLLCARTREYEAVGDCSYRGVIGALNPDGTARASTLRNPMQIHTGLSLVLAERLRLGVSVPIRVSADGHPRRVLRRACRDTRSMTDFLSESRLPI